MALSVLTFAPLLGEDRGQSAVTDGGLDADQDVTTLGPAIVWQHSDDNTL